MATEFVLIPKHKYEQLEKDAAPKDANLSLPPLSPPPEYGSTIYAINNNDQLDSWHDDKLGADDETISNTDDDNDYYDTSDVLESFNSTEIKYVQPITTLMENDTDVLTRNRKTGEIVVLQQLVQDSNVIELLRDTLTANLHPVGKMEFYTRLNILRLPCIKLPKNKGLLTIFKGDRKIVNKKSSGKKC